MRIVNISKHEKLRPAPHVKGMLRADCGCSCLTDAKYRWYIADEKDGDYTQLKGIFTDTIILITDYEGKYLKCEVTCADGTVLSASTEEPVAHTDGNPLTDWFYEGKLGVSHHFFADFILSNQEGTEEWDPDKETWSEMIEKFDVQAYAKTLASAGVRYVLLTLNQNSSYYCSPNSAFDKALIEAGLLKEGEVNPKVPRRDLPMEFADELAKYDIRLMLYLPAHPPTNAHWNPGDRKITNEALSYDPDFDSYPNQKSMKTQLAMIREWGERYGDKVAGWWFDGMFTSATSGNGKTFFEGWMDMENEYNISAFANAAKAGNPDRIITFNHGIEGINNPYKVTTRYHDYSGGESNELSELPNNEGRFTEDAPNVQKFVFSFLGRFWGEKGLRRTTEEVVSKVSALWENDVTVILDTRIDTHGRVEPQHYEQLLALKKVLEDKGLR